MKYFEYSPSQLEQKANELIERHDKERLIGGRIWKRILCIMEVM